MIMPAGAAREPRSSPGRSRTRRNSRPSIERCEPRIVPTSALFISDASVIRTNAQTQTIEFDVSLIPPNLENAVTVDFSTQNGSAIAGQEFTAQSGTLTFLPSDPTNIQHIDVTLTNPTSGTNFALLKTFQVVLSNPVNATIGIGTATGTIDYSQAAGVLFYSSPTYAVNSDTSPAPITIDRLDGGAAGVGVNYATSDGTALAGLNYQATSGTALFASGQTSDTFGVPIVLTPLTSGSETVNLGLSSPSGGGSLGTQTTSVLTISNVRSLVVTNTNDSGPGSLRQALLTSQLFAGVSTITFDIPGPSPYVISPLSPLPAVNTEVLIDAWSQPGFSGLPLVEINGLLAGAGTDGLDVFSENSVVRGLAIDQFSGSGIVLQGGASNLIVNDFIGVGPDGFSKLGNAGDGVAIVNSARNNVGGPSTALRDIISGNGYEGVEITGSGSTGNVVEGDEIGLAIDGLTSIGNTYDGVYINSASGNQIGGTTAGSANKISANGGVGVQIDGPSSSENWILGNNIGTDVTGENAAGNGIDGVWIDNAPNNTVGGEFPQDENLISGNHQVGVRISGTSATGNSVSGNMIGTNATGELPLGNAFDGVYIQGASNNQIGGARNIISANGGTGVQIFGTTAMNNTILDNFIGVDASGTKALGNSTDGVYINNASSNTIENNVISANRQVGLQVAGAGSIGNFALGNFIGLSSTGAPGLGNGYGVYLNGAGTNFVSGGSNKVESSKNGNAVLGPPSAGPLVANVSTQTQNGQIIAIAIRFNQPLKTKRAMLRGNFILKPLTNGRGGRPVFFSSISYDPSTLTVNLTPVNPLAAGSLYRLSVNGDLNKGLTGVHSGFLDGDLNGLPGGNYLTLIGKVR